MGAMQSAIAAVAELLISGPGPARTVPLSAEGAVLGRGSACEVVLDDPIVSRQHARLSLDPFGRWVVEDLGSHNGTFLDGGLRIDAPHAIAPGDAFTVGPFRLQLSTAAARQRPIHADATVADVRATLRDSAAEQLAAQAEQQEALSARRLRELNDTIDRLAELTRSEDLYPAACRALADVPESVALAVLLDKGGGSAPLPPVVLAGSACDAGGRAAKVPADLHLSRRVLEAVRSTATAVMAGAGRQQGEKMDLTLTDADRPRAVFCAPVSDTAALTEALYLDLPAAAAPRDALDFLRAVARQVSFARKSLSLAEARAEQKALDRQLATAREIQMKLTPQALSGFAEADLAVVYRPALWVGGDYCDVWRMADGRVAFAVGDVSGKGLPAAMVMTSLHAALRMTLAYCPRPGEALRQVGRHLSDHLPEGMFVTMILGVFDAAGGRLEYVNAGHILPLRVRPGAQAELLGRPRNPPLAVLDEPFTADAAELAPGEGLLIVTDGITEARSAAGEEYGLERLRAAVSAAAAASSGDLAELVAAAAEQFRDPRRAQQDDVTVLALLNRPRAAD
jgi:sigma-B regulation protein RsbU (phosphoserine phosphatase)